MDDRKAIGRKLLLLDPLLTNKTNEQFLLGGSRPSYGLISARRFFIWFLCVGGFIGYLLTTYLYSKRWFELLAVYWIATLLVLCELVRQIKRDKRLYLEGQLITGNVLKARLIESPEEDHVIKVIYEFFTPSKNRIIDGKNFLIKRGNWNPVELGNEILDGQITKPPATVIILFLNNDQYEIL